MKLILSFYRAIYYIYKFMRLRLALKQRGTAGSSALPKIRRKMSDLRQVAIRWIFFFTIFQGVSPLIILLRYHASARDLKNVSALCTDVSWHALSMLGQESLGTRRCLFETS